MFFVRLFCGQWSLHVLVRMRWLGYIISTTVSYSILKIFVNFFQINSKNEFSKSLHVEKSEFLITFFFEFFPTLSLKIRCAHKLHIEQYIPIHTDTPMIFCETEFALMANTVLQFENEEQEENSVFKLQYR